MKVAYIIVFIVLFLGYNIFFVKSGGQYDLSPLFKIAISIIIYLLSWIVWFIIF